MRLTHRPFPVPIVELVLWAERAFCSTLTLPTGRARPRRVAGAAPERRRVRVVYVSREDIGCRRFLVEVKLAWALNCNRAMSLRVTRSSVGRSRPACSYRQLERCAALENGKFKNSTFETMIPCGRVCKCVPTEARHNAAHRRSGRDSTPIFRKVPYLDRMLRHV